MTQRWNGPTPYAPPGILRTTADWASLSGREGFRAAMNSDTVRELYEAVKMQHQAIDILFARLIVLDRTFLPSQSGLAWQATLKGNAALAAYEKDLMPEPKEERHASR